MSHCHCYDCGLLYGNEHWIEAIIPDKVWNKIKPEECAKDCGILCISCIARRLRILGYRDVPVWICGTEPFRVYEGDPNGDLEILRNWEGC